MDKEEGDGGLRVKKAEIDTRTPFRSVKEAVTLFGEKVLAGEVYASKIKEIHKEAEKNGEESSTVGIVAAELEETRQNLKKAKEQSMLMEACLSSMQQELERTKRELQQFKQREAEKHLMDYQLSEIEHVKFVEEDDAVRFEIKNLANSEDEEMEFQKRRYVTFANATSEAHVLIPQGNIPKLERHPSLKKKKKKPLIPLIGGIFSRKKKGPEISLPQVP